MNSKEFQLIVVSNPTYYPYTHHVIDPLLKQQRIQYELFGQNLESSMEELKPIPHLAKMGNAAPEYVFLIHDTCLPQPGFKRILEQILQLAKEKNHDLVGTHDKVMRCHIGLYRRDFIQKNVQKIREYEHTTKKEKIAREGAGWLPQMAQSYGCFPCSDIWYNKIDLYGMGVVRHLRHFPEICLYKTTTV